MALTIALATALPQPAVQHMNWRPKPTPKPTPKPKGK